MNSNKLVYKDGEIVDIIYDNPKSVTVFNKGRKAMKAKILEPITYKLKPLTLFPERRKAMKTKIFTFVVLIMVVCLFSVASAQVPQMINYQGTLTDTLGNRLNGSYNMTFSIYDTSSGGTALWTEIQNGVSVDDGIFNVLLGSVTPIPDSVFDGDIRYLGVKVGADNEMTPRKPIVSVGYAWKAFDADTADYARAFSGTVENADKVDGLHAGSTPTAGYLYPLDVSAKIPNARLYTGSGNGLDADLLDGQEASAFLSTANDYGRSGVATDLYEGATTLTNKYVNEGQSNSITSTMITDNQIVDGDISAVANISASKINDGPGSGLDADLLDGQHGSAFLQPSQDYGRSGVSATLYEGGTPLTSKYVDEGQVNSITSTMIQDLQIVDIDISNTANISPSKILGTAWTSNNDGAGSSLDADLLDGQHAGAFALSGHNHDAVYINDGAGEINATDDFNFTSSTFITNLDADKLDGQHASAFLTTATDYGRSGVAGDLYEGTSTLTSRYVNENQTNAITSSMIQDYQIVDMDISNSANISPSKILGTAWTSNNDGSGSGLDADLLDGKHAAQFVDGSGGISYVPKFTGPSTIGNSIIYETGGRIGIGTIGPNTTTDINGDIALRSGNFVAANGNNNNIGIGARSFVIITGPAGAFTITGIAGGQDGKMVILYNTTNFNMTIANLSGLSAPGNQILTMSGANQATVGTGNATFIYDAVNSQWIMTAINP